MATFDDDRETPIQAAQENTILDTLGDLGDFIGGIGVVITLIYLATQIRQNTAALRTASRQAISEGYRESNRMRLDPSVGLAFAKGLSFFEKLPFEERHLFGTIMNDEALFFQSTFASYESGQLEEETYQRYLGWFTAVVVTPGGTLWWESVARPIYTPAMVEAVDQRIAAGSLVDIRALPMIRMDPSSTEDRDNQIDH